VKVTLGVPVLPNLRINLASHVCGLRVKSGLEGSATVIASVTLDNLTSVFQARLIAVPDAVVIA